MNTLSENKYFYIPKKLLHTLFCLFLKLSKPVSVSLSYLFVVCSQKKNFRLGQLQIFILCSKNQ